MDGWVGVLPVLRIFFVDRWMGGCNARFKDFFVDRWMGGCNARFKDYFAKTVKSIDVAFSR